MPHIEIPRHSHFPWYVKIFFWNQRRRYGAVLEPARFWGRTPRVFAALALLYGALDRRRSPIEPALRSLITVRVSQINWCRFCVDINSATSLKRGVEHKKLGELENFQSSELYSEREKTALTYAETMTYTDRHTTPDQFLELKKFFKDDEIIELTALIAFQNLSSKFNAALGVEPQGFCSLPDRR